MSFESAPQVRGSDSQYIQQAAYRLAKWLIVYELLCRVFPEESAQIHGMARELIYAVLRGDISLH
jgi:hypothetical protein